MLEQIILLIYLGYNSWIDIKDRTVNDYSHWVPFLYFIWFKIITNFNWFLFVMPLAIGIPLIILYKFRKLGGGDIPIIMLLAVILQQEFVIFLISLTLSIIIWGIIWTIHMMITNSSTKPFVVRKHWWQIVEGDILLINNKQVYVEKNTPLNKLAEKEYYETLDGIPMVPAILLAYIMFLL